MKTHQFISVLANPVFTYGAAPISDGTAFVFIISSASFQSYGAYELLLISSDNSLYQLTFLILESKISVTPGTGLRLGPISVRYDLRNLERTNLVVKVITEGGSRKTWVNNSWVGSYDLTNVPVRQVLLRAHLGQNQQDPTASVGMTAVVFDATERNIVDGFATAMMNPEKSYFTMQSTSQQAKSDLAAREKALEVKDEEVKQREEAVKVKEDALEKRENEDGGLPGQSSSNLGIGIHPPDADSIKLSATVAWPRAVNYVLGRSLLSAIQKKHDELMADWVVARGDNISSNAYDYFVYSQFVAWPKAANLENTTETDVSKIWVKHAEIMKVLT